MEPQLQLVVLRHPVLPYTQCNADARKVANHEMGHAQGLAHVSDATIGTRQATMRPGPVFYSDVQADDRDGIIDIYGAYP
ncbi:MAG: M10 family metallopeptidase domain-containing protein [Chloroflexota bacterium]|nr:M10 family metallopeptidase domain-containing protein [Chloroflexota bacterium]